MADMRTLTTMLETNLANGKGIVGWGKWENDAPLGVAN